MTYPFQKTDKENIFQNLGFVGVQDARVPIRHKSLTRIFKKVDSVRQKRELKTDEIKTQTTDYWCHVHSTSSFFNTILTNMSD